MPRNHDHDYVAVENHSEIYFGIRRPIEHRVARLIADGHTSDAPVIDQFLRDGAALMAHYFRRHSTALPGLPDANWATEIAARWKAALLPEIRLGNIPTDPVSDCMSHVPIDLFQKVMATGFKITPTLGREALFSIWHDDPAIRDHQAFGAIKPSDDITALAHQVLDLAAGIQASRDQKLRPSRTGAAKGAGSPVKVKRVAISERAAGALSNVEIHDNTVILTSGQLDRPIYEEVDTTLKALGGKWNRKKGGHVFPFDPRPALEEALQSGGAVNRQQTLQFFETPAARARVLVEAAGIRQGDHVLEPSAGHGAIAALILERIGPAGHLTLVEYDATNVEELYKRFGSDPRVEIVQGDFLAFETGGPTFDAIAMNPPFTRGQDIAHVQHAATMLKSGGRIAAITSQSWRHTDRRASAAFREMLDRAEANIAEIPAGEFKESGTGVGTMMIAFAAPEPEMQPDLDMDTGPSP